MSVGKRVSEAIEKMDSSDFEGALFAICAAIEATAKKEFHQGGKTAYKRFIADNLALITDIAFGKKICNIRLGYKHPDIKTNANGVCTIEEVFYHAVRCGLYHEAGLPDNIKFVQDRLIAADAGAITLPASLIFGFIVAVVVSPVNKSEKTGKNEVLNLFHFPLPINCLWGRREEFLWLKDSLWEAIKIQNPVPTDK